MVIIPDLEINLLFVKCYCLFDSSFSFTTLNHIIKRRWAGPQPDLTWVDPAGTLAHRVSILQAVPLKGRVGKVGHS